MTAHLPTVSYGVGYQDDFTALPPTTGDSADPLTGIIEEINYDDWMKIYGVPNSANDEWRVRKTADLTSLALYSTTYNKWRARLKTDGSNPGMSSKILVEFTDATFETLLPNTFTSGVFKTFTGNLTTMGKTIKHIYYYNDDYPDSVAATGQSIWYDFFMLYIGDFTLPNVGYGAEFTPPPSYSKSSDHAIENLDPDLASFTCGCNLNAGTWKRGVADVVDAQVIYEIAHELSSTADFVWLDTGEEQFKAVLEQPVIHRYGDRRQLDLKFTEYSRCRTNLYSYIERFGLNL